MAREEGEACLQVFVIRNGKMIGREHFIVEGARDVTDAEVLGSFLQQYYASTERCRASCPTRRPPTPMPWRPTWPTAAGRRWR